MDTATRPAPLTRRADSRSITCYVPASLDLDGLPEHLRDRCIRLMDLVHRKRILLQADPGGWVPLKKTYLRVEFGRHTLDDVIKVLTAAGVLECDQEYKIGERSRRYRATPHDGPWVQVLIAAPKNRSGRHQILLAPVHHHLHGHLQHLTIDFPRRRDRRPAGTRRRLAAGHRRIPQRDRGAVPSGTGRRLPAQS